jgi:hypothetical protein
MKIYLLFIQSRANTGFDFMPKMFRDKATAIAWAEQSRDDYKMKIYEYDLGETCETSVSSVDFDDTPMLDF